jgi:two-component system response regulator YesN
MDVRHRDATVELRKALYREAIAIIERDYAERLDINTVADEISTSRRQLQRAFAEAGRTSFSDYLTEVRLRKAAELLSESELTVREVANSVGYRQPSQFAQRFRRRYGSSPSRFRPSAQPRFRSR